MGCAVLLHSRGFRYRREDMPLDFNLYRDAAGRFSRARIALAAMARPFTVIPALLRLDRNCRMGCRMLRRFFCRLPILARVQTADTRARRPCRPPSIKARAWSKWNPSRFPRSAPGEILIRVEACGICHTDLKKIAYNLLPRPAHLRA